LVQVVAVAVLPQEHRPLLVVVVAAHCRIQTILL
jgi:hypothetical protein